MKGMPKARPKTECRFCGEKMTILRGGGEPEKYSCPRCKAVIFQDQGKQPRCPQCGQKAYKVISTHDKRELLFVHDIRPEGDGYADYGHRVNVDDIKGGF